ncbi:MAG: hypothetical protein LBD02_05490 [Christensenellaceae bacterium]|jgi:hypothetical protein|nr:hypothetical protein [Christensenellaceae bacterium]
MKGKKKENEEVFPMLYARAELKGLQKKLGARLLLVFLSFLLPFSAGLALMFTARSEWLSLLLSFLGAAAAIFLFAFAARPPLAYYRFVKDVTEGVSHTFTGRFLRGEERSFREGIWCETLYFEETQNGKERLCYLDAERPYPFEPGREYGLSTHGQSIIGIEEADAQKA